MGAGREEPVEATREHLWEEYVEASSRMKAAVDAEVSTLNLEPVNAGHTPSPLDPDSLRARRRDLLEAKIAYYHARSRLLRFDGLDRFAEQDEAYVAELRERLQGEE